MCGITMRTEHIWDCKSKRHCAVLLQVELRRHKLCRRRVWANCITATMSPPEDSCLMLLPIHGSSLPALRISFRSFRPLARSDPATCAALPIILELCTPQLGAFPKECRVREFPPSQGINRGRG
jgi:hypothetical protein